MTSDRSTQPSDNQGESDQLSSSTSASLSANSVLPISQGYTLLESHTSKSNTNKESGLGANTNEPGLGKDSLASGDSPLSKRRTATAFIDEANDLLGPRFSSDRRRRSTRLRFRTTYTGNGDVEVSGLDDAIEDLEDAYGQSLPLYDAVMLRLREASRKRPRLFAGMATWLGVAGLVYVNSQYADPIVPLNIDAGSTTSFSMVLPSSHTIQGVMQQNYDSKLDDIAIALEANALLPEEPAEGLIRHQVSEGESLWHLTQMYQLDAAAIAMSNGIDGQTSLDPGRVLYIPRTEGIVHRVRQGDTLASIASDYEVTPEDIIRATPLTNSNFLSIGQRLVIPAPVTDILDLRRERADALAELEAEREAEAETARLEAEERAAEIASGQSQDYTVRPGDTLGTIAARYGTNVNSLIAANPGVSIAFLRVGQDLVIPGDGTAPATTSTSTTSTADSSSSSSQSYRVQSGDTLGVIARRYNVSVSSLIASNPGVRATNLQVGRNLAIPSGGTAVATVATSLPPAPVSSGTGFVWPVAGNITSGFGWRWGRMHNGVDIPGPYGSPIVAVQGGTVIFAGWHAGGYGNMVKIQHPNGLVTLYAHGNQIHVAQGQTVRQGQLIMGRGSTGWSTGPHLHFEVHVNGAPVNPYGYLN